MNDKMPDSIGSISISRPTREPGSTPPPPQRPLRRSPRRLPSRLFRPALIGSGLLLFYLFGSLLLFPLVAPRLLAQAWEQKLGRPVTIARAEWQPFGGRLILHNGIVGPRLADPYDRVDPLLSFRSLRLKVDPVALWRPVPWFKEVIVEQGYVHLVRDQQQNYNFTLPESPQALLAGELEIRNSRLDFSDHQLHPPFTLGLSNIRGVLRRAQASPDLVEINLQGQGPEQATLTLQGRFQLRGEQTTAVLRAEWQQLPLKTATPYLTGLVGNSIARGYLDWQATINRSGPEVQIEQHFRLTQLVLAAPVAPASPASQERGMGPDLRLAQALLTPADGVLRLDIPLNLNLSRDNFYRRELTTVLRTLGQQALDDPLILLEEELPEPAGSRRIAFQPGRAELNRDGGRQLDQLAGVLARRPLLNLRIQGLSDPGCDQAALLAQQEQTTREQIRQAVATLTRQLASDQEPGSPGPTVPLAPTGQQPTAPTSGDQDLLNLAAQRQEVVHQRLTAALTSADATRLLPASPEIRRPDPDQTAFAADPASSCAALVELKLGFVAPGP